MVARFMYPSPPKSWPQIQVLRLTWRLAAKLRTLHQPHFNDVDMPMAEFDMLSALGNTDGLRMKDLAETMITTPSNVTRVCLAMEKKGLVQRERSVESDREVIARLTPAGEALFADVFPATVNYSARVLNTGLSERELRTLSRLLSKLLDNVHAPE